MSAEEAQHFLNTLTGRDDALKILRAVSLFAPRLELLEKLLREVLPPLLRSFTSRTEVVERRWEGGFHGRLHIARTQALHLAGERTSFVTRSPVRSFDLAENQLVRAVCRRLLEALAFLRSQRVLPDGGWGLGLRDCEGMLRHLLGATVLREVRDVPIGPPHLNSARSARMHGYRACASWWQHLQNALDDDDPRTIAQVVAEGALLPIPDSSRFELAVMIRVAEQLHQALDQAGRGAWRLERALVLGNRDDALALSHASGRTVRIYYNQSVLPEGHITGGARHYLANYGRLRPDVTIAFERGGLMYDAVVIECKLSEDPSYVRTGYHEACIYAGEYAPSLRGTPKAMLVASSSIAGEHRADDDVVAIGWRNWPTNLLLSQLVKRAFDERT